MDNKKYCQIYTYPMWIYFTLLDCVLFYNDIEKSQL